MRIKAIISITLLFICKELRAVRPFITDDARVVGYRLAQWETWLRFDRFSQQQWHMAAYGPSDKLELSLGVAIGLEDTHYRDKEFSYAAPLVQAKYLFSEYGYGKGPGLAIVAGSFLPGGSGPLVPPGPGAFSFLAVTQCFGKNEDLLIHANLGANYLYIEKKDKLVSIWGLGTQIKTYRGAHIVGEIFSGDPYIAGAGMAYQTGIRYFFNENFQVDATLGKGLSGENKMPFWGSVGLRLVTSAFQSKQKTRKT